ncbi:Multidrug resistance protein 1, partial [Nowakowskiella sp. JEL0078]
MRGMGNRRGGSRNRRRQNSSNEEPIKIKENKLANASKFLQFEALFTATFFFLSGISADDYAVYLHTSLIELLSFHLKNTTMDILVITLLKFSILSVTLNYLQKSVDLRKSYLSRLFIYVLLIASASFLVWKSLIFISEGCAGAPASPIFVWILVVVNLIMSVSELGIALRYSKSVLESMEYVPVMESDEESLIENEESVKTPKLSTIPWKRLFLLVKDDWGLMSLGMVFLFVSSVTNLVVPWAFGEVVDIVNGNDPSKLVKLLMILFAVFFVGGIAGFLRALCITITGYNIVKRLRTEVFRSIIYQEMAFFDATQTGDLVSRLSSDCQVLKNAISVNVSMLIRNIVSLIVSLFILFAISWKLTVVMFSVVPVVVFGSMVYGNIVSEISEKFQDKLADATSVAQEVISQVRTVRSFAKEDKSVSTYSKSIEETHKLGLKLSLWQASFQGILTFVPMSAILLVLYYGAVLVMKGEMTSGILTSFLLYTLSLVGSFGTLSSIFGDF